MKKILAFLVVFLMAGCSYFKSDDLSDIEQRQFLISGFDVNEKPQGYITIYDAIARSFKTSLDARYETLADIIDQDLLKQEYNAILPKIVEVAGYRARYTPDFYFASLGAELETRTSPTTSKHRNALAAVWNMIDFSITYSNAKTYKNKALLNDALKRKAMQNIVSDVNLAFYKVAGVEQIEPEIKEIELKLLKAINNVENSPNRAELSSYENALKVNLNQIIALKKEGLVAKLELSSLLGLGKYINYRVQPPVDFATEELKRYTLNSLEIEALKNRKNDGDEDNIVFFREQVGSILPDAEFGYNQVKNYDYFQNQVWEEAGLKISWNLISLMNSAQMAITQEEKKRLLDTYDIAEGTAILSEVNIAYLRFNQALNNFTIAMLLSDVKSDISAKNGKSEITNITDLEKISNQIEAIMAKMKIYYSYGELKDAEDILLSSVGIKTYPSFLNPKNVKEIVDGKQEVKTKTPIKVNLDDNIEKETWATGDNWLEGTLDVKKPQTLTAAPVVASDNNMMMKDEILIDVKRYYTPPPKAPTKAKIRKITPKTSGNKTLQIGSFSEEERALIAWQGFVGKYPSLGELSHTISVANISGVGTVYRLSAVGSEAALKQACKHMSDDLNGTCIIR